MSRILAKATLGRDLTGWPIDSLGYGTGKLGKTLTLADTATHNTALPVDPSDSLPFAFYSLTAVGGSLHIAMGPDNTITVGTGDGQWDLFLGTGQTIDDFMVRNIS